MIIISAVFVVLRIGNAGTHRETRNVIAAYVTSELAEQHADAANKYKNEKIIDKEASIHGSFIMKNTANPFDPDCRIVDVPWVVYSTEEVPFVAHVDQFLERFC